MHQMFKPISIGSMEVKNRFVHSATHEVMSDNSGMVTDALVKRYARLARGGIGLIIPGHMYVHPLGKAHNGQTGVHTDEMTPGLKSLADTVHEHGGKIAFQLAHGGRQSTKKVLGRKPLAPSSHGRDPVSMNKPEAMSEAQIEEAIDAYAAAAGRAVAGGADAVQLHAAHGYLINEFLSPFFNRRTDAWGGSDVNRFLFLKTIVETIRDFVPNDFPILVKLNTNDFTPKPGMTPDLAAVYAGWLADLGVAAVEVSCGTYYGFQTIRGEIPVAEMARGLPAWMRPVARLKMKMQAGANRFQEAYNLAAAEIVKGKIRSTPLILVGGMRRLSQMNDIVENGPADMISMSRPFIREPSLVRKFEKGETDEAACISCNNCFAAMFNEIPIQCYRNGLPDA